MSSTSNLTKCGDSACGLSLGERLTDGGMELIRCPKCQVLRIPDEKLVHDHVLPDPVGKLPLIMKLLMSLRMLWLKPELPRLADKDVRIADIGCGDGQFLEFLAGNGYRNIFGIEPDSRRAINAQQRGVPVFASRADAEAAGKFNGGVDLMFVWHVLEHVDTPAGFIAEYANWLAPGGKMVISVPNHASMQTRLFGYFAAYPDYGRHIWYHEPHYLDWMQRNSAGLKAEIMRDRNVEYEVFAWVDSIASAIVREQNFIHKALKKGNGGPGRKLAALLAALALLPVAAVLTPISLIAKRGSTLTFVLTRP